MSYLKNKLNKIKRNYNKLQKDNPKAPMWTTREGVKIPINKMGDTHLVNTINYLKRRTKELGGGKTREVFPIYRHLRKEATDRGLKC